MGRSVSYASSSEWVKYTYFECDDEDDCQIEWDWFVDDLRERFKDRFPSLYDTDEWLGREDRAILENGHVYIGVSQYFNLVSVWCKVKDDVTGYRQNEMPLRAHWAAMIEPAVDDLLSGQRLVKIATFSNGESMYQKVDK